MASGKLRTRAANCLYNEYASLFPPDYRVPPEYVATKSKRQLLAIPGLGRKRYADIEAWLAFHGFTVGSRASDRASLQT